MEGIREKVVFNCLALFKAKECNILEALGLQPIVISISMFSPFFLNAAAVLVFLLPFPTLTFPKPGWELGQGWGRD